MHRLAGLAAAILLVLPSAALAEPIRHEVRIASGDAVLAGTLTLPEGKPRAAVVLIQGTGPHTRDQVISGAPMFAELADGLAARGVASLRVDRAGVGKSTGREPAHYLERAAHAGSAVAALAARPELKGVPLGLVGHSEGALIAYEIAAAQPEPVRFVVLLGAPARPGRAVWVEQQANPANTPGLDAAGLALIRETLERIVDASLAQDEAALGQHLERLLATARIPEAERAEIRPQFMTRMLSAEMRTFLASDPEAVFARVTDPVLAVWGEIDALTAPAQNVSPLIAARNPAARMTVVVLPQEDHFFLRGEGLAPGEHKYGKMRLSGRLVETIDTWLTWEGMSGR